MTRFRNTLWLAALISGPSMPLLADDGMSGFMNGALVFGKSKTITMKDETLTISRSQITADFHFVNTGKTAETITVAFPLPDINTADVEGLNIPVPDDDNFVGFTTTIDDKRLTQQLEQRAFTADGREITEVLKKFHVPLLRTRDTYFELFAKLPEPTMRALIHAGAVAGEPGDRWPQWITKTKFYFEKTFKPGKPVHIVHRYKPSFDTSNMSFYSGEMATWPSVDQTTRYCLTGKTKAAVAALEKTKVGQQFPFAAQFELGYVLSTAKTWAGLIGHYHLIIDTERADVVASFCGDAKRTSPTRFELERDNYVPDRDLEIIMFELN